MFGVPSNLDLKHFTGVECTQVCLGLHQVQIHFAKAVSISIEGRWELCDSDGEILDQSKNLKQQECMRLHVIVGRTVVETRIAAPKSITIVFDNGLVLEVFDSSHEFESFQIQPGDIIV